MDPSPVAPGTLHQNIDPAKIKFSQRYVNNAKVDRIAAEMKKSGWTGPPIDVVSLPDGSLTSVDNHRVLAAQRAGIDVKATVHSYNEPLDSIQSERFSGSVTWGDAVGFRINSQGGLFRDTYPDGSPVVGVK
jgi:hypothetical protein